MIFELVTPEKLVLREEVDSVSVPTTSGEITILANHVPLVSNVSAGVLHLTRGADEEDIAVYGGVIQISEGGRIRLLAETAERGHELVLEDIEAAHARAEKVMSEAAHTNDVAFAAAAAALERETARLKTVRRHRGVRHQSVDK